MLTFNKVNFKYGNAKEDTLRDISLTLQSTEILAIVGPSGGGKSTFLRVLAGLEKPYSGEITIDGVTMFSKSIFVAPEKRGVGMVFQDYALFPHMTVEKNIEFGLAKLKKTKKKKVVEEVMGLVDMVGYEKRYPYELSGGQQQRIALARAIAPKPKLLLLDEPFSNLDAHLLQKVRKELFKIVRKAGITTIMVTHNVDDAYAEADRIISIERGTSSEVDKV